MDDLKLFFQVNVCITLLVLAHGMLDPLTSNSVDELIILCLAVDGLEIEFGTGLGLGIG